jgi:hypothetical protein
MWGVEALVEDRRAIVTKLCIEMEGGRRVGRRP